MEEFELAKSDEERKKEYERIVKYLMEHGIKEEWKIKDLIKEKDSDFGLNNTLPELNSYEIKKLDILFAERKELIEKYKEISDKLKDLLVYENELWTKLQEDSHDICQIEGHRLSEKSYQVSDSDGYGRTDYIWFRKCIICGKEISQSMIKYRDCVVKGEEGPKRILYNYKKKEK